MRTRHEYQTLHCRGTVVQSVMYKSTWPGVELVKSPRSCRVAWLSQRSNEGQTSRASRLNFPRLGSKRKNWAIANSFFLGLIHDNTMFDARSSIILSHEAPEKENFSQRVSYWSATCSEALEKETLVSVAGWHYNSKQICKITKIFLQLDHIKSWWVT